MDPTFWVGVWVCFSLGFMGFGFRAQGLEFRV